jgi:hypothetical protein
MNAYLALLMLQHLEKKSACLSTYLYSTIFHSKVGFDFVDRFTKKDAMVCFSIFIILNYILYFNFMK